MRKLTIFFTLLMMIQYSLVAQIPKNIRKDIEPSKPPDPVPTKEIIPVQKKIVEPTSISTIAAAKDPLRGFADLHCHQMANLAYGGQAFHGKAFGNIGMALPSCATYHSGAINDFSGWIMQ